ncbi:MAG: hypothetical protein RLY93_06750 [Sumerlaeia bacterium]
MMLLTKRRALTQLDLLILVAGLAVAGALIVPGLLEPHTCPSDHRTRDIRNRRALLETYRIDEYEVTPTDFVYRMPSLDPDGDLGEERALSIPHP